MDKNIFMLYKQIEKESYDIVGIECTEGWRFYP